ncbi:hypothetical protein C3L33_06158, partial [Rhododendron williamsianum]
MDPSKKRRADENGTTLFTPFETDTAPPPLPNPNLTLDDARKIILPFTQPQLLDILQPALLRHPDVLAAVRSIADADPARRKLFVRGLGWETTTEKLRNLFSTYGDVEEAVVITDKATGKSKGYGFVTFRHVDGALVALKEPSKKIDGRMTVTQLAAAGISGANAGVGGVDVSLRKIFVGNVPFEISSERLLGHFSAYGEVEEGPLGFDKQMGKERGFAFFVYKTEEGARASLVDPAKNIDGHQVMCKLAEDGKRRKPSGDVGAGVPPVGSVGPGSLNSGYGVPGGGPGGYGGFSGGLPHQNANVNPGFGNQGQSSFVGAGGGYGPGLGGGGGGYGGSQYGVSGSGEYGGYRLPPSSIGMPSGGYAESGNYGLSTSSFPTQLPQPSSGPRFPPGGMYQGGMQPYY